MKIEWESPKIILIELDDIENNTGTGADSGGYVS